LASFTATLELLPAARSAAAQVNIEVGDHVSRRFAVLGQFWGNIVDDTTTNRRLRLSTAGQVDRVSFFVERTRRISAGR